MLLLAYSVIMTKAAALAQTALLLSFAATHSITEINSFFIDLSFFLRLLLLNCILILFNFDSYAVHLNVLCVKLNAKLSEN